MSCAVAAWAGGGAGSAGGVAAGAGASAAPARSVDLAPARGWISGVPSGRADGPPAPTADSGTLLSAGFRSCGGPASGCVSDEAAVPRELLSAGSVPSSGTGVASGVSGPAGRHRTAAGELRGGACGRDWVEATGMSSGAASIGLRVAVKAICEVWPAWLPSAPSAEGAAVAAAVSVGRAGLPEREGEPPARGGDGGNTVPSFGHAGAG